jgi:hypothetical protein
MKTNKDNKAKANKKKVFFKQNNNNNNNNARPTSVNLKQKSNFKSTMRPDFKTMARLRSTPRKLGVLPGPNDILPGNPIPQMNPELIQTHYGMTHAHKHKKEGRMKKFEND